MEKLCLGCMRMKRNAPICEHCGFDEETLNQPHQLSIGTLLQNQYLVGRVLGQGGFGITYIGWDQHLSIPVAIKEFFPSGAVQRNTQWGTDVLCISGDAPKVFARHRERFLKEARTLAQLSDIPEIVGIKSFFPENETAYIIMEYVEGITLKQHLKKLGKPMPEAEVLAIMEPVLKALQKVHDQGLIHRDISPDNIMLPKSGGIKLIDFGTVRYLDESCKSKSTETVLKAGFAPMEQYNSRGNLGTWTDVYALCATLHYLLTGKIPADVHSRLEEGEALTILRSRAGISPEIVSALEKGMKLRAAERIQTIEELNRLLYAKKEPAKQTPRKTTKPTKGKPRKKKTGILAVCAAAAVVIGAAAMLLTPPKNGNGSTAAESSPETTVLSEETLSPEERSYREAAALEEAGETARAAIAFGKLGDYADSWDRSSRLWTEITGRQTVVLDNGSGYINTAMGIRQDGTLRISGYQLAEGGSPITYPPSYWSDWTNLVSIHCGYGIVGLRSDGTVLTDGYDSDIDTSDWEDIVAVYALNKHIIGQKADGTLVFTGKGQYDLSPITQWEDIAKVYLRPQFIVGLKADGTIEITGRTAYGHMDISTVDTTQWTDIVKICVSNKNIAGLRSDGTMVAAGDNEHGQNNVSGWTDIVDFAIGGGFDVGRFTVGLKADGTVVTAGYVENGWDLDSLTQWTDIREISVSNLNVVGLKTDGTLVGGGREFYDCMKFSSWTDIKQVVTSGYVTLALHADGTVLAAGSNAQGQCNTSQWQDIVKPITLRACFRSDGTLMVADRRFTDLTRDWTDMLLPTEADPFLAISPASPGTSEPEPEVPGDASLYKD